MKSSVFTKVIFCLALTLALGFSLGVPEALAQTTNAAADGLETVGSATGLGVQDPTIIVAKIIRAVLGVLGIIAVVILIYGGFVWMTAGGSEDKVTRAKRIIINAGVGLFIILTSLSITQFVLGALQNATGGDGGGSGFTDNGFGLGGSPNGTVFSVTRVTPVGEVSTRNVVPQITFSQGLDAATITSENIKFTYADGTEIPGVLTLETTNRVSFVPATPCPEPNTDRGCFEDTVVVNVAISTAVKSATNTSLSCTNNLCNTSFTTGSIIDVENPVAQLELPDDGAGVASDSRVDVQVSATDDAQVAVADFAASDLVFDSVPATGDDLTDVLINTIWDTAGLLNGSSYTLTATVIDIAGNTDEDSITVDMRPATCFNQVVDGIETGLNCGGDSTSTDYCGACDGSSCTANDECSSGVCENGVCTSPPAIQAVSPASGAPGTWVTLSGTGFGNFNGSVAFTGELGPVPAFLVPCGDAWSNTQVIAIVPEGAIDGPISLTTSSGLVDTTYDDHDVLIADFDVNEVDHPGLCDVSPDSGLATDALTLTGEDFGFERGTSTITFDTTEVGSYSSWSETTAAATVPSLADGDYAVTVTVDGVPSNPLNFEITSQSLAAPSLNSLSPNSGGVGQYVTLSGLDFGTGTGVVWFESPLTGERVLADTTSFPAACTDDFWSDQEVLVIVPEGLAELGAYNVILVAGGQESNPLTFTLNDEFPTPGLCTIDPPNALAGATVTLHGDNFGEFEGSVTFTSALAGEVQTWTDDEITVTVPAGTVTGAVVADNGAGIGSNPVNFEVSSDAPVVATGKTAAYAWSFSSGLIPDAPEMIFECSDRRLSGVPNDDFDNQLGVCVNAAVFVEFTLPMNEATLSNIVLEECVAEGNIPCEETVAVEGALITTSQSVRFDPLLDLKKSTVYQVTSTSDMLSVEGAPLANAGSWTFTTREDATPCRIERVLVAPDEATIRSLNGTHDFAASPVTACSVLKNNDFTWSWSTDEGFAHVVNTADEIGYDPTCTDGNSTCALVGALSEGETLVTAKEGRSQLTASASLTIDFSDPYVANYWPNCTEACVNAEVGASFNTPMKRLADGLGELGLEQAGAVRLYSCTNELCNTLEPVSGAAVACTPDAEGHCLDFHFVGLELVPLEFYRVIVSGQVVSASGVALTRANYGGDFSWTFRVREDASLCAVDRITVSPEAVVVDQIGAQQAYTGEAYGEADSCSVSGQRLSGFSYNWNWTSPIADDDLDNDPLTRAAIWHDETDFSPNNGGLIDTDPSNLPIGCTASCTAAGSLPETAICGDGAVDYGEECDDGNTSSGDGCSMSCLHEGSTTSSCGNGLVEPGQSEDCDDGKQCADGLSCSADADCTDGSTCDTRDNDGCSAVCLAEGSSSIGATCGNGDIAVVSAASLAGEECDDGNAARGDGCSNECLFEGSPTLTEIGGAVCGNGGAPEIPAEECEDGNVLNGDGCSSSCLFEGASVNYFSPSVCGDNLVGTGEACDDDNTLDGDGCSSECLREGSSTSYAVPSFCGDGLTGAGELAACEVGGGDGNIDPIQVALVPEEAALEVNPDTQLAVATIEVTEVGSGLSTEATLSLSCAAESDAECTDPNLSDDITYGVGANNCCMVRPEVTLFPNGDNVCRNAAMYAIFTEEMDLNSFEYETAEAGSTVSKYRMYARLDLGSTVDGVCPADHTTLAVEPRNLALRLWNMLVRLVGGRSVRAAAGDCVVPIDAFQQSAVGDGTYKVQLHASAMLAPNAAYELVIEGDDAVNETDTAVTGVTSEYGVGIIGTRLQAFTVGPEVCVLDNVEVIDTHAESPYVFSQGDEQHAFLANGVSYASGIPQEIDSIEGVYSWDWTSWEAEREDEIVTVAPDVAVPNTALVTAVGENGEDTILVTAAIEDNTTGLATAETVIGAAPITAFLCENPWPGAFSQLPWSDTPDGDVGAEEGEGWMNFSTMYCRDNGEQGIIEDLPEVVVVRPPITESVNVMKEYLFEVAGSSDAIGIRVVSNPNYLSPEAWYASQGFTGSLSEVEVDGYQAGKDGRTTYVVAPNQSADGNLYSNVYVMSYNEGASSNTIEIYDQMLENFRFAVNVDDAAVCVDEVGECSSARDRLRRDTRRLTDMTDLRATVLEYKLVNGVVPTLPSGSFVRSLSSSVWESWNSILGGALGDNNLPTDPLNTYLACGTTGYEAYSADTCVDEIRGSYVCPVGSQAYHYKAIGDLEASLYADLEYTTGTWANPIEADATDGVTLSIGNSTATVDGFEAAAFCDGSSIYGASTTCGDGVVGAAEVCELGQLGGTAIECETADGLAGTRSQICNNTCSGYTDNLAATCVVASCGNGVVEFEAGEDCDDGSLNGVYGFCGNDCTRDSAFFCGDGQLAGGEACDCGADAAMSSVDSRAYGAGAGSCGVSVNGVYAASPNGSCAWNCAGPAAYCGDGTIDSGEVCDGTDETWAGELCGVGSTGGMYNQPCTDDSECGGTGVCGGNGLNNRAACPLGFTRVMSCDDAAGASCTYTVSDWFSIACTEIGTCGDGTVDPGEACDDGNTDGSDSCTDQCTANVCGDGYVYLGEEQCDEGANNGAGCEAAYGSSCTACSLSCRYEVSSGDFCGDGEANGTEFCDANDLSYSWVNYYDFITEGDGLTGIEPFGSCTSEQLGMDYYYDFHPELIDPDGDGFGVWRGTVTCQAVGVCNGGGSDVNGDNCLSSADCGGGECVMPVCSQTCNSSCPLTYASVPLQLTTNQPGADISEVANFYSYSDSSTSDLPNAATITIPACNVATQLTASVSLDNVDLPTTYIMFVTDLSLSMKNRVEDNTTAVAPEKSRLEIAQEAIPEAIEELYDKLGDNAQIGAIGYRGLVQNECFLHPEVSCAEDPLGSHGCVPGQPCDDICDDANEGDVCNVASSDLSAGSIGDPYGYIFGLDTGDYFVGPEDEDELVSHVTAYVRDTWATNHDGHGTFTYEALMTAKELFDDIADSAAGDNARYITILLSDGEVTTGSNSMDGRISPDAIVAAQDFDDYASGAGYELYTATIGDIVDQVANMKNWSSNSYNGFLNSFATVENTNETDPSQGTPRETSTYNGLDYAYEADTESGLEDMYDQIVDSIVEIAITIVSENNGQVVETSGSVEEGDNVVLPWPSNFVCDDLYEQQVPVQISFPGVGQVQVSDVRLNYCAP